MKKKSFKHFSSLFITLITFTIAFTACDKANNNDDDPDNAIEPLWTYDTGEDPYQSTPFVSGDKVLVCTLADDDDPLSKPGTHCINKSTGQLVWKINDTATVMVISPVVYNNLIIEGGLNPHARRLSDGGIEWKFVDDIVPASIYSNPLVAGGAAYFASPYHFVKLNAGSGALSWEVVGLYNNLRSVCPVLKNNMVYYADASYYNVTQFRDDNGQINWAEPFSGAFANKPLVTDDVFYVGIQDASMGAKTLRCMYLSDRTDKWGVELGTIMSDLTLADGKIYAIGMQTIYCRTAADGSAVWSYNLVSGAVSEPLVHNGKLYVGYGKGFMCLDAATGALNWDYKSGGGQTSAHGFSSPTVDGNRIYVSCSDGKVYCFDI